MLGIILETMYQFETHQSNLRMRIRMSRKSIGYIVTCIFLSLLIGTPISVGAQPIPSLQVLCDTTDNPQQAHLPDPFPGIFYRVLFPDDTQSGYILEQVSQNGIESFPIPIPSNYGFFAIQTPEPVSIPEWWLDSLGEPDRMISNMETFLAAYGYPATSNYVGPNCINVPISASPTYPTTCDTTDQINDLNIDSLDQ
jgi:hypothetical protein